MQLKIKLQQRLPKFRRLIFGQPVRRRAHRLFQQGGQVRRKLVAHPGFVSPHPQPRQRSGLRGRTWLGREQVAGLLACVLRCHCHHGFTRCGQSPQRAAQPAQGVGTAGHGFFNQPGHLPQLTGI